MNFFSLHFIIILLAAFVFAGCTTNIETVAAKRKFHQCKNYELDVPIETVDAETSGKKSGETHFPSFSTETSLFFSYDRFESEESALEHLKENEKKAWRILRKSEIKDESGKRIGDKTFITTSSGYELLWTTGAKLNSVSGESLPAIEEIEKDCNL